MGSRVEEDPKKRRKERKSSTTFTRQNNRRKQKRRGERRSRSNSLSSFPSRPPPSLPGAPTVAGNSLGEERSGRPSGPSVPFPPPSPKVKPCSRVLAAKISGFYRVILKGENLGLFGRLNLGGSRGDSVRAIHFRCARASGSTRGFGCLVLGYGFSFSAVSPI
jgi:hypothetical protein